MPLVPQRTAFPVTAGQEQSVAPELIDPPALTKAHNVTYTRAGELQKRRGWFTANNSVVGLAIMPDPERLMRRGDELLTVGEYIGTNGENDINDRAPMRALARIPGEGSETGAVSPEWLQKGYVPRFNARKFAEIAHQVPGGRVGQIDTAFAGSDVSTGKGLLCVAWGYSNAGATQRIDVAVLDVATGSVIYSGNLATDASAWPSEGQLRCVATRGIDGLWYFRVFYTKDNTTTSAADIYERKCSAKTPWSWIAEAALTTNVTGFDICVTGPNHPNPIGWTYTPRLFLVITNGGATVSVFMFRCGNAGVLDSGVSNSGTIAAGIPLPRQVSCACDPDGRHVAINCPTTVAGNPMYFWQYNTGNGVNTINLWNVLTSHSGISPSSATRVGAQVGWRGTRFPSRSDNWTITQDQTTDFAFSWNMINGNAGAFDVWWLGTSRAWMPYARPFNYRGQAYTIGIRGVSTDAVCLEALALFQSSGDGDPFAVHPNPNARFLAGEIQYAEWLDYALCFGKNSVVESAYEGGRFFSAFATSSPDSQTGMISIMELTASDAQRYDWTEVGGGVAMAGGIPWFIDNSNGHELGFAHRPQCIGGSDGEILVGSTPHIPTLATNTYSVALVWESIDASGRVSRSAPSFKTFVHSVAANTLTVTFEPLGSSSKNETARPVLYVSNDAGVNHYRSEQVIPALWHSSGPLTVVVDPVMLFANGAPTLYTDQGILENAPPMSARFVTEFQSRVWLMNNREVWYSREVIDGEEPSFNEALSFKLPYSGTGFTPVDDRLVIFTERGIFWLSGDGPTDTGQGGGFAVPQRIPSDFTCVDARSIVRTEKGACFRSARGIEIIDRNLSPRLISGGVDHLLREDGYSEIVAAHWDRVAQVCRFVARNPTSDTFIILCWHSLYELWTTASVPDLGYGMNRVGHPRGIMDVGGRNWIALADSDQWLGVSFGVGIGREWLQSEDGTHRTYLDGFPDDLSIGKWYQAEVQTGNLKLDGLLGFQRVWKFEALTRGNTSKTGIELSYSVDFSPTVADPPRQWVTAADVAGGATQSAEHWAYSVHVAKQQCHALRVTFKDLQVPPVYPALYSDETRFALLGFGVQWGQEPGTGRGNRKGQK